MPAKPKPAEEAPVEEATDVKAPVEEPAAEDAAPEPVKVETFTLPAEETALEKLQRLRAAGYRESQLTVTTNGAGVVTKVLAPGEG